MPIDPNRFANPLFNPDMSITPTVGIPVGGSGSMKATVSGMGLAPVSYQSYQKSPDMPRGLRMSAKDPQMQSQIGRQMLADARGSPPPPQDQRVLPGGMGGMGQDLYQQQRESQNRAYSLQQGLTRQQPRDVLSVGAGGSAIPGYMQGKGGKFGIFNVDPYSGTISRMGVPPNFTDTDPRAFMERGISDLPQTTEGMMTAWKKGLISRPD